MQRLFAEHGCLGAEALPLSAMKNFLSEGGEVAFNPERMKPIVALAERYLTTEIPICPASLYIQFVTTGNRTNYEEVYFLRRRMAFNLALAEAFERKGRFTEKLMDAVWAMLEETSWVIPAHLTHYPARKDQKLPPVYDGNGLHGVDLFAASTGAVLAVIHSLCKEELDAISPIICERLRDTVVDRLIKPFNNAVFNWTGERGNTVNNWNPWILSNLLTVDALMVEDDATRTLVFRRAMNFADNFTEHYGPDGGCNEGPHYWTVAGAAYFDLVEVAYAISGGAVDLFGDPLLRAICEYEPKMNIKGDLFVNFADCPPRFTPPGSLLRRMGERVGSELLCAFGDETAMRGDPPTKAENPFRIVRNLMLPSQVCHGSAGLEKVWFPNLKVMTARENGKTGEGFFLAVKGGHNNESHNHNDVGNAAVAYDGKPVLIDTGCGAYTAKTFSDRRYELWYMQSHYHNTVDFGGVGEREGEAFRSTDECYDEATGGVSMQLCEAYPPEAGILSYVRSAVLTDGRVRIRDRFDLNGEREVDIHFLTAKKPELGADHTVKLAEGRTLCYDGALTASIEEFPIEEAQLERFWETPVLWRIHLCATVKKGDFETVIE